MTQSDILFQGSFFRLTYPASWEQEIIEDVICFFKDDGCGALQIASSRLEDIECDLEKEMESYLARNNVAHDPKKAIKYQTSSNLNAIVREYMYEGRFWMVQLLNTQDKLLIVLYNADEPPDDALSVEISQIISSITIT